MILVKLGQRRQEAKLGPIDALDHLLGFFLPALAVGPISAALAKLVWRNELRPVGWSRLALWATAGSVIALVAGLVAFGRDGGMASYAAMVLAAATGLMWSGFGPGRR